MENDVKKSTVLYREVQRPPFSTQFLVIVIAVPILIATLKHLFFNEDFGSNPSRDFLLVILGIICSIVLPAYYVRSFYEVKLTDNSIVVKSWPFNRIPKSIPLYNLYKYRAVSNMAVGFLTRIRQHKVYSGFGSSGVQLEFDNRNQIYVGSRRPQKLIEAIDLALNKDVGKYIMMNLDRIQPAQLYLNSEELARYIKDIQRPYIDYIGEIPVKKVGDHIIYTDNHTRAFAAYFLGLTEVRIIWVDDDIDDEEYLSRLNRCRKEGIHTIADLRSRIVSADDFKSFWLDKINS